MNKHYFIKELKLCLRLVGELRLFKKTDDGSVSN